MSEHRLKTWPEHFDGLWSGEKKAEYRRDDRGFVVGDMLILREWNPDNARYSGRQIVARITHILRGVHIGLTYGYAMLSIEEIARWKTELEAQLAESIENLKEKRK